MRSDMSALRHLSCFCLIAAATLLSAQTKGSEKVVHASGPFDVKVTPLAPADAVTDGRYSVDKQYHGALNGTGKGEMLTAGSANKSGAYVAIEKINGTLNGRAGTFSLVHVGIMDQGKPNLSISVVPGSGTGELAGIDGAMKVNIATDGKHSYEFDYTLPAKD
jgi:hypothetical protein